MRNNRGVTLIEVLGASVCAMVVAYAAYAFMSGFLKASVRTTATMDAKYEADALNTMARRAIHARSTAVNLEFPTFGRAVTAFDGCGTGDQECTNLKVTMTNPSTGGTKTILFQTQCEDFDSGVDQIDYSNIAQLPGGFTCNNSQRPTTTIIETPDASDSTNFRQIEFPRGSNIVGAFFCARECIANSKVWIGTSMIYRKPGATAVDGNGISVAAPNRSYGVHSTAYIVSLDETGGIEILPPPN